MAIPVDSNLGVANYSGTSDASGLIDAPGEGASISIWGYFFHTTGTNMHSANLYEVSGSTSSLIMQVTGNNDHATNVSLVIPIRLTPNFRLSLVGGADWLTHTHALDVYYTIHSEIPQSYNIPESLKPNPL